MTSATLSLTAAVTSFSGAGSSAAVSVAVPPPSAEAPVSTGGSVIPSSPPAAGWAFGSAAGCWAPPSSMVIASLKLFPSFFAPSPSRSLSFTWLSHFLILSSRPAAMFSLAFPVTFLVPPLDSLIGALCRSPVSFTTGGVGVSSGPPSPPLSTGMPLSGPGDASGPPTGSAGTLL